MKTSRNLKILAVLLFTILANKTFAQLTTSPYIIYNNKSCNVELHYRVFDPSSGCTLQCSANNVVIPPGGNISISCVVAGNSDIEIVLIGMGGQAISPIANVNYGSGTGGGGSWSCFTMLTQTDSGSVPFPASIPCTTSWSIIVGPNDTNIN